MSLSQISLAWLTVVLSWWTFIIYWFIAAFKVKRTIMRESLKSRLLVLLLVGAGCQMLFSSMGSNRPDQRLLPDSFVLDGLAIAAALGGLAITIWARRTLAGNWSASVTLKEGHELIQAGPYQFMRHPIYTGFFLMSLAAAIVPFRIRGFAGFALVIVGFWYKLLEEEKLMTAQFPDQYPQYRARVKAIVPWVI